MTDKNKSLVKQASAIHQIMIVDGMKLPEKMPVFFKRNSEEILKYNKGASYRLWSGEDVRQLIGNYFDREVLETYDALKPYAYKADLARLCVLYIHGGLYIDLGVKLMKTFSIPENKSIAVFRDLYQEDGWFMMQNGLIYSEKNRPELLHAINWTVQNRLIAYYGKNSLYPTGPVQLGRAVALVAATSGPGGSQDQWIGECRAITPSDMNKNMIYTDPLGNLTAVRAKIHAGDLAHMGLRGGNNHNKLWQSRRIYGEKTSIWTFDDEQIRIEGSDRKEGFISPNNDYLGNVTWGPYVNLKSGNYKLNVCFVNAIFENLTVVVCSEGGVREHYRRTVSNFDLENSKLACPFFIDEESDSVEFKIFKNGVFLGGISNLELEDVCVDKIDMTSLVSDEGDFFLRDGRIIPKEDALISEITLDNISLPNRLHSINILLTPQAQFARMIVGVRENTSDSKEENIFEFYGAALNTKVDIGTLVAFNLKPRGAKYSSISIKFFDFSVGAIESIYFDNPIVRGKIEEEFS